MKYELKAHTVNSNECRTIIAEVVGYDVKHNVPILEIPMMSDEQWEELAKRKMSPVIWPDTQRDGKKYVSTKL